MQPRAALVLASTILTACVWRSYTVECTDVDRGLTQSECDVVAGIVADGQPANQLGDLQMVTVDLLECTPEDAHAFFARELAGPNVDRCWVVTLAYEGGDLQRVAYREFGGEVQVP